MNVHWKKTGLTLLAGSLLLAGCAKSPQATQEATVVPVSMARATPRDLPETLLLPGRVMPREQTSVVATTAGQIQSVLVHVGDSVKKGQLLATLESGGSQSSLNETRLALNGLETQVRHLQTTALGNTDGALTPASLPQKITQLEQEAQANLTTLIANLQSPSSLQTLPQLVHIGRQIQQAQSQVSLLQAQTLIGKSLEVFRAPLLQTLQAQLVQARQAVRFAEAQLQATRITSPFDGVILAKNAIAGTPSGPGVPLFSVGSVADVDFEILVDSALQTRLKQGQTARVQIGGHAPVTVQLASVSPSLDVQAKSFTAHATLDNESSAYKPGEVGQAMITLDPHRGALSVPTSAILQDAQGSYVLQVQGGTAIKKPITTGYNNGTYTEVLTGLQANDEVIHEGLDRVQPGTKVQIAAAQTRG
ncbi:efflux RND transporter periplasmic adaptor subunit [Tumebacillus permanentifrigoris]|uniref:RND family efflux transporter MFP subunit n=1 Tax=Tumebacillus permanentifrigoris TaxID=378543 RepID=A0A316DBH8_9BACL|nr:efflux RND transporter periplasmic adaptor subunit [Tumebacillus permanentifrigoris]PWK14340.1 RND family efflux transporter MFP subunit [Tumebacillus permanentifrigoris]